MPNINVLKNSKFLSKGDVEPPILVTITGVIEENVAADNQPADPKWCLTLAEVEKPFVCNITNGSIIAGFLGSEEMEAWVGHQIVLYHDPNVSFGGKLVGGIRARAPRRPAQVQQPRPAPAPQRGLPPPKAQWPTQPGPPTQAGYEEEAPF